MLDPRIYRAGLVAVAVAVIVLAFSLRDQQGALSSSLAPDALNGQNIYNLSQRLATEYPDRRPGSAGDDALAGDVAQTFGRYGFATSTTASTARTVDGKRTIETVTGTRPGLGGGSIVVLAHRDALDSAGPPSLTGTATVLELARVLAGETHQRTIVLASTSASAGDAGAAALARSLTGVDAVIALGDLGGSKLHDPVLVPWSDSQNVAPTALRNTVSAALSTQAAIAPGGTSLAGQMMHLAFPLTLSEQGPFGARGVPAVLLSTSGERAPPASEQVDGDRVNTLGRSVLQTINALDASPGVSAATPYLLYDSKLVPPWAIKVLVLGLMLPVLLTAVDVLARARRRGYPLRRWTMWTLAAALPFAVGVGLTLAAHLIGWIGAATPGPLGAGDARLDGSAVAILVALVVLTVLSFAVLRWLWPRLVPAPPRRAHKEPEQRSAGRGPSVLVVLCLVTVAIWLANPFAALFLIPALHLWMWVLDPDARMPPAVCAALLLVGLLPPLAAIVYYAVELGLTPVEVLWNGVLLIAGGHVSALTALEWSIFLGCLTSIVGVMRARAGEWEAQEEAVTIRGPLGYAGPGSLGGTESALRR